MKTFENWVNASINNGDFCSSCIDIAKTANKAEFMDLVLNPGGITFLQEMQEKNRELDYSIMENEFSDYINGKYIGKYANSVGKIYTGVLYVNYTDVINVTTNYITLFNCQCDIILPENQVTLIVSDKNCKINIICPKSSKYRLKNFGGEIKISNYSK